MTSNLGFGDANSLTFVGCEKSIAGGVDWRSPDMPRLWRYHLHYFDYLNDASRSTQWKRNTIRDWIEQNPYPTADAWEAYPLSLRVVNWIKYFERCERDAIEPVLLQSLYEQVLWLENNLERRVLANHFLKNAKALIFAGVFFEGRDADRWRANGLRILLLEAREQFLTDGGHYERSPMYHMICVEDLLDVLHVLQTAHSLVTQSVIDALTRPARAGLAYLDAVLMPDGDIPLFNDAAFGVAPAPKDLFQYGRELVGYEPPTVKGGVSIRSLAASGYYVIRDGDDMLVIDCGLPGPAYQPGHGHSDCLSYELALAGERVVVDTGVRDYDASSTRRYARSTAAHNTITIDGRDQSEMWDVFRIARRARPIRPALTLDERHQEHFVGAHDGFRRLGDSLIHRRTVVHTGRLWSFEDTVSGRGKHRIENRIHLAPGLTARYRDGTLLIEGKDGKHCAKIVTSPNAGIEIAKTPYFPRFGVTEVGTVIVMALDATLPTSLTYAIERLDAQVDEPNLR